MPWPSPARGLRWNSWNLLLVLFLMLVVSWFNRDPVSSHWW